MLHTNDKNSDSDPCKLVIWEPCLSVSLSVVVTPFEEN